MHYDILFLRRCLFLSIVLLWRGIVAKPRNSWKDTNKKTGKTAKEKGKEKRK